MRLAARGGLIDIWRKTGLWPDYCSATDAPYDCKIEAAKATRAGCQPRARRATSSHDPGQ